VNWISIRAWVGTACRLLLAVVWIWAGWAKLGNPRGFVQAVRAYDATPEWLSKAIGYGLPILELAIGVLLVAGLLTRLVAAVSAVLLVIFAIGLIQAAARGIKLECGCFGGGGQSASTQYTLDILRDVGLLAVAVFLVVWPLSRLSVDERLARHDYVAPPSAKRMRSADGARKYNALVEMRKREARSRTIYLSSAIGVLIALVVVIGIGVQSGRAKIQGDVIADHANATDGVVLGKAAKATVDIYEDFQCPICQQFQQQAGADIDSMISSGRIQARFHMMAFLDSSSNGNRYSTRAANAAFCASDINVQDFLKYHDYLYGKDAKGQSIQPTEGSNGRTDADLIGYARAIGISGTDLSTFQTCVQTQQHVPLVQAITDNASKHDVNGTPTIKVNGKTITATKAALDAAVTAVAGPAPTTSPSSAHPTGSTTKSAPPTAPASSSPVG
jgi:protein-disulfide isomerase